MLILMMMLIFRLLGSRQLRKFFRKGYHLRVWKKDNIRIWHDPWLPTSANGKVYLNPSPGTEFSLVSSLFEVGVKRWDIDIL